MDTHSDLRRELGFWAALTIGAGTMIGAGIFLLSGVALSLTGPAAIISYVAAGVVCIITAASAAELATGMPTSGGDYFFVSRSLGPAFGAISGIGIWLSLTFAIAFYLFGMGEYLAEFLPLTPFWGAVIGAVLFTALNVIGAKESGGVQVVVVLTLLVILGGFALLGILHMERAYLRPFFPYGKSPILSTTALVFISFLGFVKIAAVSEEIKDPGKNLPRALIGSVALVTCLYVLIVLVVAGMFPQTVIARVRNPLTEAAKLMLGDGGAAILIFGGLLATLSSANASIMAASRINLAMARDGMVPNWLSRIHPRRLTPYRAILITGGLALAFLFIESLETLAEIASVLQLYSYGALNAGAVVLRVAAPDWYRPAYRVPGAPFVQAFAALGCLGIVLASGLIAQAVIVGLIVLSLTWYFTWGRSRVNIEFAMPRFRRQLSREGWQIFFRPAVKYAGAATEAVAAIERALDPTAPRRVMVALANPRHEADLLRLGRYIAAGQATGGHVFGIHLVRVPLQTPLQVARERFVLRPSIERTIAEMAERAEARLAMGDGRTDSRRAIAETEVGAVTDVAHDVFGALISETIEHRADLLLMGWQGGFNVSRIYNSPVQRIMSGLQADLAILKNRGLQDIQAILVPWGGGVHARLGLEVAARVARATGAAVHVLRVVRRDVDTEREQQMLRHVVETIVEDDLELHYHVAQAETVIEGIQHTLDAGDFDLVIIGASHESAIRRVLFGTIPDIVADRAACSVLMVRRYLPRHWSITVAEGVKRFKESAGLTTSPEVEDV
jgi:amino acid transporter/nucleotide-binding universal stress UspA family protein